MGGGTVVAVGGRRWPNLFLALQIVNFFLFFLWVYMGEYWHSFPLFFFSGVLVRPLLGFVRVLSQQVKLLI